MNKNEKEVKQLLAEQLGVDIDDLHYDDSLTDDLHIYASELTDFTQKLQELGYNTASLDFSQIETLGELFEALGIVEDY